MEQRTHVILVAREIPCITPECAIPSYWKYSKIKRRMILSSAVFKLKMEENASSDMYPI
jgi:hypothetical protein